MTPDGGIGDDQQSYGDYCRGLRENVSGGRGGEGIFPVSRMGRHWGQGLFTRQRGRSAAEGDSVCLRRRRLRIRRRTLLF